VDPWFGGVLLEVEEENRATRGAKTCTEPVESADFFIFFYFLVLLSRGAMQKGKEKQNEKEKKRKTEKT
jgi:hypothetical protein